MTTPTAPPGREQLPHSLDEAAELEHNPMCACLYAASSLRQGEAEGLSATDATDATEATEATAVERWRREIIAVAIEEMGHPQDGEGFAAEHPFKRGTTQRRLTPMARDSDTVGHFYATLGADLRDGIHARNGLSAA